MAHIKAGGSRAAQGINTAGRRLGIKLHGGQKAKPGSIIVRQRGSVYHPGKNTKMGRDFTIYSVADGYVTFVKMTGYKRGQKRIDIVENI